MQIKRDIMYVKKSNGLMISGNYLLSLLELCSTEDEKKSLSKEFFPVKVKKREDHEDDF